MSSHDQRQHKRADDRRLSRLERAKMPTAPDALAEVAASHGVYTNLLPMRRTDIGEVFGVIDMSVTCDLRASLIHRDCVVAKARPESSAVCVLVQGTTCALRRLRRAQGHEAAAANTTRIKLGVHAPTRLAAGRRWTVPEVPIVIAHHRITPSRCFRPTWTDRRHQPEPHPLRVLTRFPMPFQWHYNL
jgi:hypothetical protein